MKATILSLLLLASFAAFGENAVSPRIDEQASHYADTLVNIVFTVRHADVFEDWLDSFRKDKNYSQEAMARALVSIVERSVASGNEDDLHTASTAISAMSCLQLTNMLPVLREWVLRGGDLCPSSFCAYGEICGNDKRYLDLGLECVNRKVFSMDYLTSQLCSILSADKQGRLGVPLDEPTRVRMQKTIFDSAFEIPPGRGGRDAYFCQLIPGYSNSQERVMILKRILDNVDTIPRPREGVRQLYLFPYDNKGYEYDDLTNKVRSFCEGELKRIERLPMANSASVAEIIRTKSIPENERLNMTAILDAKLAAIEAAEARDAHRAAWKRRFRLGTFLILPILSIAFAVHLVLKKKTTYGKSSWWRTVEALVVVFVMVAVVGVVSIFEHRREIRKITVETNPSATLGLETTSVVWQKGGYDKYRREKELADTAVLKFRVTNQLDSMIGQFESLKLARNQLLIDLAQVESRMSNETVVAEMDMLGKQAAALREKVAENVRACEELHVCISNQEHTLVQLESTRKLANQNFSNFIHHLEGASLPIADPPAENAIEAAQARAARREVWKRRLRIGALVLPIPVIAVVILVVLKKRNDKSGWCRTTESFVAVIVMVALVGVLSFFEHRHQAQKTTTETPSPAATKTDALMTESDALQWLETCREKFRQEKECADDAVVKFLATNQLDFLKSQYESLKLAHDLLLLDLAKAESRESNEVATAYLVSLREKETENARARAELQDRISKVEGRLSQLESARCLADDNLMFILKRIEEVRFSMKKETPMWE